MQIDTDHSSRGHIVWCTLALAIVSIQQHVSVAINYKLYYTYFLQVRNQTEKTRSHVKCNTHTNTHTHTHRHTHTHKRNTSVRHIMQIMCLALSKQAMHCWEESHGSFILVLNYTDSHNCRKPQLVSVGFWS